MGVTLSPAEDRFPTEEELARKAGLVPGSVDEEKFLQMRKELDEKGLTLQELMSLIECIPLASPDQYY